MTFVAVALSFLAMAHGGPAPRPSAKTTGPGGSDPRTSHSLRHPADDGTEKTEEVEKIGAVRPGWTDDGIHFTAGARRGWVEERFRAGIRLHADGTPKGPFTRVLGPRAAGDGLVFDVLQEDGRWAELGESGKRFLPGRPARASGGALVACLEDRKDGGMTVRLLDGRSFPFDEVGGVEASPDGRHVCFWGRTGERARIYLDGRACTETFDFIDWVAVSPRDGTVAFWGFEGDSGGLVLAGVRNGIFEVLEKRSEGTKVYPRYTRAGVLVYRAVPLRGREQGEYVHFGKACYGPYLYTSTPVVISPNGVKVAFTASRADKEFVVCNGSAGPLRDEVRPPVFSEGGDRIAYVAFTRERGWFLDGAPSRDERFEDVIGVVFEPSGTGIAYAARCPEGWRVVAGEAISGTYDRIWGLGWGEPGQVVFAARRGSDLLRVSLRAER